MIKHLFFPIDTQTIQGGKSIKLILIPILFLYIIALFGYIKLTTLLFFFLL